MISESERAEMLQKEQGMVTREVEKKLEKRQ
jgi:hypothetical protein